MHVTCLKYHLDIRLRNADMQFWLSIWQTLISFTLFCKADISPGKGVGYYLITATHRAFFHLSHRH